jgi:hypothetical protein
MKKSIYAVITVVLFTSGWLIGIITHKTPAPFCPSEFRFNMDNRPDTSFTVADGAVEVFYPSEGLYRLGAELERKDIDGTEMVIISADPEGLRTKPHLKRVATDLIAKSTTVPADFDLRRHAFERPESHFEDGHFKYINGHETYIGTAKETYSSWTALFVHNNHLIEINMGQAQLIGDPLSMAAWANNDLLFDEIVNRIQLHD